VSIEAAGVYSACWWRRRLAACRARAAVSDSGYRLSQQRGSPGPFAPFAAAFREGLKDAGYVDQCSNRIRLGRGGIPYGACRLAFSECDIEVAENGMSDDEEESVRQKALAEEQFLLVELPAALRKIRAKARANEKLARKLVFGKLKYTGPEVSFSSSHASVMKALDAWFHVIVGKAAYEIDKTRELLKELKREAMMR
jgi:hypothetical protein